MLFMKSNKLLRNTFVAFLTLTASIAQASTVTIPNTFAANTPALAAEVNENFNNVKAAVDDNDGNISSNDTDIAALLASVTQLQADLITANNQITMLTNALADTNTAFGTLSDEVDDLTADLATANATIDTHNTRISAIEGNTVLELDGFLMLSTMNGYDTAEFTNINVQVNDGSGTTSGVVNGLGNLTIGYNETSNGSIEFCSDPQYTLSGDCALFGETWARNVRRGSHNLIVGIYNSYDDYGSIISGTNNVSNAIYANVIGGSRNMVTGVASSIIGGQFNIANGIYSSILGGQSNETIANGSSILGGHSNTTQVNALFGTVSGGRFNDARGYMSSISGGYDRDTPNGIAGTAAEYDWHAGTLTENY